MQELRIVADKADREYIRTKDLRTFCQRFCYLPQVRALRMLEEVVKAIAEKAKREFDACLDSALVCRAESIFEYIVFSGDTRTGVLDVNALCDRIWDDVLQICEDFDFAEHSAIYVAQEVTAGVFTGGIDNPYALRTMLLEAASEAQRRRLLLLE